MSAFPTPASNDDEYNSASDEDFNPDLPPAEGEDEVSDSGNETTAPGKRKALAEDADFDNSGDEATIKKAKKTKRKHDSNNVNEEDEGGEGGLIKTRAQRRAEQKEKKVLASSAGSKVDVNALWTQMATGPKPSDTAKDIVYNTPPTNGTRSCQPSHEAGSAATSIPAAPRTANVQPSTQDDKPMVTIKRTYDFAGQTMTEEKTVSTSSAEAKLYLAEQARQQATAAANPASVSERTAPKPGLRRPKKRASMFGTGGTAQDAPDHKGLKLTTLQKSQLDWAAHVDQEGISDELEEHKRAKEGYLGRMDFLGRMDAKRENELKEIKSKK